MLFCKPQQRYCDLHLKNKFLFYFLVKRLVLNGIQLVHLYCNRCKIHKTKTKTRVQMKDITKIRQELILKI